MGVMPVPDSGVIIFAPMIPERRGGCAVCGVQWSYKRCRIAFHHLSDAGTACAHQRRPAAVTIERYSENTNKNKMFQKLGSGLAPPSKAGSVH